MARSLETREAALLEALLGGEDLRGVDAARLAHLRRQLALAMTGGGNASCVAYVDERPDPTNNPLVIGFFAVLYLHLFVLGLAGNSAIIYLTFKHRHLQNIFILNLALSDVIVCLLSLPFTPVTNIYKTWYFGSPFCHLLPMVQGVSIFVSTWRFSSPSSSTFFSLASIAIDRFNLVVRPHRQAMSVRGASLMALVLWVVSVVVCLPYGWYMVTEKIPGYCGEYCNEHWPSQSMRRGYSFLVLSTQFLLPFATMAVCYSTIFYKLRRRAEVRLRKLTERSHLLETSTILATNGNGGSMEDASLRGEEKQRLQVVAQQRRTTTILASMVLMFGATWLPHNALTIAIEYQDGVFHGVDGSTDFSYIASMITHSIAMLTNVVNPILYAWLNPSFKEMLLKTIRRGEKPVLSKTSVVSRKETAVSRVIPPETAL